MPSKMYLEYSSYTDPGDYEYLYRDLPDDIVELNEIIKAQLIHPIADLPAYKDIIPEKRHYEDYVYPDVKSMLKGLVNFNSEGLVRKRKPEQRLVVTCRYHAILLASILKHKGIPVRVRYGFVPYLVPGSQVCHIVTEIWKENKQQWILADPDRKIEELHDEDFVSGAKAWLAFRKNTIDVNTYGVETMWGFYAILDTVCHDFISVLGREILYNECPPACADGKIVFEKMPEEQITALDTISELLADPDKNLDKLKQIYENHEFLQYP